MMYRGATQTGKEQQRKGQNMSKSDDEIMGKVDKALNTLDSKTTNDLKAGKVTPEQAQDKYDAAREKRRNK